MSGLTRFSATAFAGRKLLATGSLAEVVIAVRAAQRAGTDGPVRVFNDASGRAIHLDLRGSEAEILNRIETREVSAAAPRQRQAKPRGRGRPKLGVVGREVTLLPAHWDWLERQPGNASQALRRLIDAARRADGEIDGEVAGEGEDAVSRKARAVRTYRVMATLGAGLPGYEEAVRALFAGDFEALDETVSRWPRDVAAYVLRLAGIASE